MKPLNYLDFVCTKFIQKEAKYKNTTIMMQIEVSVENWEFLVDFSVLEMKLNLTAL